ncbi:MAG: glycosyltransferase family 2 protein [Oscillospiraceae bacterium]|nr:glycosyltransferase family 2 protein [Oscillospiraceae bacterium]
MAELLSLVVPCYNEENTLPGFFAAVGAVAERMRDVADVTFEFLFVDDGSTDKTLALIKSFRAEDKRVRYLSFSRNFGKESAILAGLRAASGKYVALMDADFQDPPELLPEMYHCLINEGYDCVAARRASREGEPKIRSFFARRFYRLMSRLSRVELVDGARDFRMMTRKVVDAVLSMPETSRFSKGLFAWVGFKTKWLPYEYISREGGRTKWSFFQLLSYSLSGIFAFSQVPLAFASVLGVVFFLISVVMIIFIVIRRLIFGDPVSGWASTVCIVMFIGSIQFLCIGIMGGYVSRIYLEVKNRPAYFIREDEDDDEDDDEDGGCDRGK